MRNLSVQEGDETSSPSAEVSEEIDPSFSSLANRPSSICCTDGIDGSILEGSVILSSEDEEWDSNVKSAVQSDEARSSQDEELSQHEETSQDEEATKTPPSTTTMTSTSSSHSNTSTHYTPSPTTSTPSISQPSEPFSTRDLKSHLRALQAELEVHLTTTLTLQRAELHKSLLTDISTALASALKAHTQPSGSAEPPGPSQLSPSQLTHLTKDLRQDLRLATHLSTQALQKTIRETLLSNTASLQLNANTSALTNMGIASQSNTTTPVSNTDLRDGDKDLLADISNSLDEHTRIINTSFREILNKEIGWLREELREAMAEVIGSHKETREELAALRTDLEGVRTDVHALSLRPLRFVVSPAKDEGDVKSGNGGGDRGRGRGFGWVGFLIMVALWIRVLFSQLGR